MDTVRVDTQSGPIEGRMKEGALLFAGVPYAAPPVDTLRFKPPEPHPTWTEVRPALKFGPAAPQLPGTGMTGSGAVRWDEDCLTLNVSTPACDTKSRAVLVWIHGGAYRTGQGSIPWYNGARFAKNHDIVVVSINYRLGALGFADLSHLGDSYANSATAGTLDQIAALEWVRDNIERFGGDPGRVTLAGESAGAFSVTTLMGCAAAQGLFQQAIPQSGAAHHTLPRTASRKITEHFLGLLGVDDEIGLSGIEAQKILDAQGKTIEHFEGGNGTISSFNTLASCFYPAHETPLLPESPYTNIRNGEGSNIALLIGSNADETTLWGYGALSDEKAQQVASARGADAPYAMYAHTRPEASAAARITALTTDHMFRMPALRVAEAREAHTSATWVYQFNWRSRAFDGKLGATHALEIPFAFDNLDRAGVEAFIGPGDKPQHVADTMHQAWAAFINTGNPGWSTYNTNTRTTMLFDDQSGTADDPAAEERLAWADVI